MPQHAVRYHVLAVLLLLAVSVPAFARCSTETVRGAWAFQNRGSVMLPMPGYPMPVPVPFVSLGTMDVDWPGTFALHATLSVGGQVQEVDTAGLIRVNRDCTVTMTDSLAGAAQGMVFDDGREMRLMTTAFPLGPSTNIAYFRRIAPGTPRCSNATVRGVYRGTGEGTFMVTIPGQPQPVAMPFSGMFTTEFDGEGGGGGAATAALAGTLADVTFTDISMIVNRDCTATLRYSGVVKQAPGQVFSGTLKYIVLDHGDELLGMEVESSIGLPLELEHHKRVSMVRPAFFR